MKARFEILFDGPRRDTPSVGLLGVFPLAGWVWRLMNRGGREIARSRTFRSRAQARVNLADTCRCYLPEAQAQGVMVYKWKKAKK
jgi:hypothetical protein